MAILASRTPTTDEPIRVFLCDDVAAFRSLMRFMLEEDPEITVVGEAGDGIEGVAGVETTQPDVVLLDLAMPRCDGMQAMPLMRHAAPGARIVALSGFTADRMAASLLDQGASAYVEKGADLEVIRDTVRGVAASRVARAGV